ncbi:immunity 26/phosphotriesterase HocA family protein [Shinella sp. CPCC 100929]|uniref:Immunity 26/phosphotriesterase HocA family protein n=1 Tax=Shinella lacus TaxID=2654216 RepID=A0ABT1R7S8_9HYPH|nr:Imm26 family immunity protein [Shinella lacus]MCQ4631136.1 immunity 26/phosphotriesterase HocA family protein [Shinella lacus]
MNKKAHVGDVFLIPIDGSRFGIGQIAGDWIGELYIVIYDAVHSTEDVDPNSVASEQLLLAALSLDAKIHCGDWRIIGNVTDNLDRIPQPVFKVNQDGQVFLESRDRSITRPASRSESETLRLRTVVAPVRLENALKALKGVGDWNAKYDELRVDYVLESSRLNIG